MAFAVGKNCAWFVLCSAHTVVLKAVMSLHCLKNSGKNPLVKTVVFLTGIMVPFDFLKIVFLLFGFLWFLVFLFLFFLF